MELLGLGLGDSKIIDLGTQKQRGDNDGLNSVGSLLNGAGSDGLLGGEGGMLGGLTKGGLLGVRLFESFFLSQLSIRLTRCGLITA